MFSRLTMNRGMPVLVSVAAGISSSMIFGGQPSIHNESKRRFYEDESNVVPVPGTVTPAAGSEVEILGPNRLVDGISVRSPSALESTFKSGRESVASAYNSLQGFLNNKYVQYNEKERQVTSTVSGLHNKTEDLLPNGIYILIAALSGNIMARQRGIVSKATFPVILGVASFKYFLPQTFSNTTGFIWSLEEKYIPEVAHSQQVSIEKADEFVNQIEKASESSQKSLQGRVQSLRQKIADVTGLNIDGDVTKK